ncbi:hypothetical protein N0V86_006067 [Didymella sp. IMI 355093]|nr:hypothetical protein N0V86_006067 [Didymella sp. IMI 355093]
MNGQHTASAMQARNRDAFKTPHLVRPPAKAVTISAATVFKKRKLDTPQRSTVKRTSRKTQVEEMHPLALAFKESSEEYRRHLYSIAVAKINTNLDTLLHKLYESNLQTASSDPADDDPQTSPLKLTVPAKYQRLVQKLYNPLSSYPYLLQRADSLDKVERMQTTVHDRFRSFEENIQVETGEVRKLQRQWESVVAEIFQLGVAHLGKDNIAILLSSAERDTEEVESILFIPEHGDSTHKGKGKRKRVSFASPDMANLFPGFLFQTSAQQRKSNPVSPDLPAEEVQQLEQRITDLGKQHAADLQRLEKEHQTWWNKKQTQLAHTLMQD